MKVCIRCNPISELIETDDGLECRFHGKQYLLEEQDITTIAVEPMPTLQVEMPPLDEHEGKEPIPVTSHEPTQPQ